MTKTVAIEAKGLAKKYITKKRTSIFKSKVEVVEALKGISFNVKYGEVVGLLGPNGAGKTTTIKIIATLLRPDKGKVYIDGLDAFSNISIIRRKLGIMLTVEKGFYPRLTGLENLEYFGVLYGLYGSKLKERVNFLIKLLELDSLNATTKLYEEFSLGMKARLAFARALIHNPQILLLDEPTLGLDPISARRIRSIVKDLAHKEGKAILYTTHNMFEAEIVCDRILLINKGIIVAEGTPEELKSKIPKLKIIKINIRNCIKENVERVLSEILGSDIKVKVESVEGGLKVKIPVSKPEEVVSLVLKTFVKKNIDVINLSIEEPSLEDVFIYFAKGETS